MARREFTRNQKEQIVERSKRDGKICCERCGLVLDGKPHEIDHIIAEANRPDADKKVRLTIAEGQLLGKECCHRGIDGKTNADVKQIAKGKRQFNRANGLKPAPKKPLRSAPFPPSEHSLKRQPKTCVVNRPSLYEAKP